MTDKTDLIREIHEYVTAHGGENTATHLLVQAASAIQTQAAELEAVGAGGVSGPLMGIASLSANAGEPVAWLYESPMPDGSVFTGASAERLQVGVGTPTGTIEKPLYLAAPPTAQAEGWRAIETAPQEGVFLVYSPDEARPARRVQVADWHPNVKVVGGLFAFDCAPITHWMPLPLPPTSAEGVKHG